MTPVERLRAAEQRLRGVAGAATPGPWDIHPNTDLVDPDGPDIHVTAETEWSDGTWTSSDAKWTAKTDVDERAAAAEVSA